MFGELEEDLDIFKLCCSGSSKMSTCACRILQSSVTLKYPTQVRHHFRRVRVTQFLRISLKLGKVYDESRFTVLLLFASQRSRYFFFRLALKCFSLCRGSTRNNLSTSHAGVRSAYILPFSDATFGITLGILLLQYCFSDISENCKRGIIIKYIARICS